MQQFEAMGYDLRTSPQSEYYDYGTTGGWSDHVPLQADLVFQLSKTQLPKSAKGKVAKGNK